MHIGWYMKRLRVMSTREIVHRLGEQMTLLALLHQYRRGTQNPALDMDALGFVTAAERQLPCPMVDRAALCAAAPEILEGRVPVAGRMWQWEAVPGVWHRAPDSGKRWPKRFFATIPYRENNPVGDVRLVWEPSRLQHLVDVALLARSRNPVQSSRAVALIEAQLISWVSDNPPLTGVHYVSVMECGLRLIAVCHALDLIRDHLAPEAPAWMALTTIVASHAPLIARRLSLHSSAGNHTTAEAVALVYAGTLFPEMRAAPGWLATGLLLLEQVAEEQILADGGGIEQATAYHRFNLQLLHLAEALLDHHGSPVPEAVREAIERGNLFLGRLTGEDGTLPPIGDSDSGWALSRHMLTPQEPGTALASVTSFESTGLSVVRAGQAPAVRLHFDHGPLGMPPAYGHGHADALSVLLNIGDEDVLIDTGTFTYTGDAEWRTYFRSTRAHNTVTVAGRDQAAQVGRFLWTRPWRACLEASTSDSPDRGLLRATHDGYTDLGVTHQRTVAWRNDQWIVIHDALRGPDPVELELHWHLGIAPTWVADDTVEVATRSGPLRIQVHGGTLSLHRGERSPIRGWRSPVYGVLERIHTLRATHSGALPHDFTTVIHLPGNDGRDHGLQEALAWISAPAN